MMKTLMVLGLLGLCASQGLSQKAPAIGQSADNCAVNIAGTGNTASLICKGIDPKLAEQVRAILNGTRRNAAATKEISEKLDLILRQLVLAPPDVALRFVYSKSPALVGVNRSDVAAKEVSYGVILWNLDLPDRIDPLPIPTEKFGWIRPREESGPMNLFDRPQVSSLLKPGNRLMGVASISCAECITSRQYIVYIVWGEHGWFLERVTNDTSFVNVVPTKWDDPKSMQAYYKWLESEAPLQRRIEIPESFR